MFLFTAFLVLCAFSITSIHTEKVLPRSFSDVGIISTFLQKFIKPFIDSIHGKGKLRNEEESRVEKAIRLKISDLKPFLQDNEENDKKFEAENDDIKLTDKMIETDNNLTLKGSEETTIIEFVPKNRRSKDNLAYGLKEEKQELDPFQNSIKKYKALRHDIEKALDKENCSSSTKALIKRTLDEMIAMLIERQCTWKSVDTTDLQNHIFKQPKNMRKSMRYLEKLSNKQWMSLRKHYLNFLKINSDKEDSFIKQFHDFFSSVINNNWNLGKYKVRCQLDKIEDDNSEKKLYQRQKPVKDTNCDNFRVCTDELKYFFKSYYNYLNETTVSAFKNYAAMYSRDVKSEMEIDKDIVESTLDTISTIAEKKVIKIFRKRLGNFTLDEKKSKKANIDNIKNFIKLTKEKINNMLLQIVDYELSAMKTKLFEDVKADLVVNLKADLDSVETLFTDKVCMFFVLCNGNNFAGAPSPSRRDYNWVFKSNDVGKIYVKVQLSLDDELKNSLVTFGAQKRRQGKDMTQSSLRRFDKPKSFRVEEFRQSNLTATRTTISSTTRLEMTGNNTLGPKQLTANTASFKATGTLTPKNTLITMPTTKRKHTKRKSYTDK
ncbi:unnamed protein product [Spodoptera exigua]|nr:unnamed protein product [Spodoptera exigua]